MKAIETVYNGYRFRSRLEAGSCDGAAALLRAKWDICAGAEQPVPPNALRNGPTRAWCGACARFVAVNYDGCFRRHRLPVAPPVVTVRMPTPETLAAIAKRADRSLAILDYLTAHSVEGVSTVGWQEAATLYGVSREWVRQLSVKAGIAAKPSSVLHSNTIRCPDCGNKRTVVCTVWGSDRPEQRCRPCAEIARRKTLELVCDCCREPFQRSGKARAMHIHQRKSNGKRQAMHTICPACHAAGVVPQNLAARAAVIAGATAGRDAELGGGD